MSNSLTPLNNSSSSAGKLLEHCIAQRACIHTGRIPTSPQWRLFTVWRTPPWGFAKTLTRGPQSCRTMALLHTNLLGLITATLSMWFRWSFTSSSRPKGMFLGLSLKGFWSVALILCLAASVHPISPSSSAKMSCYSASKLRGLSLFSSVRDSRLESSNFSNKIFLISSTVSSTQPSLAHLRVQSAPTSPSATTTSGTSLVATIRATAVPFLIMLAWSLVL